MAVANPFRQRSSANTTAAATCAIISPASSSPTTTPLGASPISPPHLDRWRLDRLFGTNAAGVPFVVPQLPVRAKGGFTQLGLPLSRWFGHDPEGRHAGWSLYVMYGTDQANTRDLLHTSATASSRARSDMSVGTLNYKLTSGSLSHSKSLSIALAPTRLPSIRSPVCTAFLSSRESLSTNGETSAAKAA